MARPAEKARAMMNKWVAMRDGENQSTFQHRNHRRPGRASECEHLTDAEKFRGQIVREISTKIDSIQNPALPEHEIRLLNDSINHLQREKFHWNKRIVELGGVDYNAMEKKRRIEQGDTQMYSIYRYYGVAKDLPGVKEHLEKETRMRSNKSKRSNVLNHITPDYYGWRDEDDGVLLELEADASRVMRSHFAADIPSPTETVTGWEDEKQDDFFANVPSQDEIAAILLLEKKRALLKKYAL